jgi:hypothetical protein
MHTRYKNNYSVAGLQEPDAPNVLSLEQKASKGNLIRFDETGNQYRVLWADEPLPTEFDAACLEINNKATLRLILEARMVQKWATVGPE